ncbi:MAG: ATP-binding protein [Oscillospiraceae bacterium]|nr:ATP-binding protein [Oscillospiraceae bacterium]
MKIKARFSMKISSTARIIISSALMFVIILTSFAVVFNIFAKQAEERNKIQVTKLYAELALSGGLNNKHIFHAVLNENGLIMDSDGNVNGESITSILIKRISFKTLGRISDFIREPSGFFTAKAGDYYLGILRAEQRFVFVQVPAQYLPSYSEGVIPLLFLFAPMCLILFVFAVYCAVKKSSADEKTLYIKDIEDIKQKHSLSLLASEEQFEEKNTQAASDLQTAFFSRVSHEIRTPMNSILGIAQIMLTDSNLSEPQINYMSDIKLSADSLLKTINDILDISRLSAGKMSLYLHDYNFIQFVDNISAYARFTSENKNLEYNFNVPEKLPQCLFGDSARLKQLLTNLISNAVKFTKKGSVSFSVISRENDILFEIKDTGMGIKPEHAKSLFDPFSFTLKTSTGAGLGLAIAKSLARLMDGDISFESEYEAGSTFTVIIPKIIGDSGKLQTVTSKASLNFVSDTRILIVDDNEINLNVAKGLVTSLYGIECDTALSGIEALAYIEKNKYDLIFMDHMMPEMDGIQTTKRIREKNEAYATVPVVALTANTAIDAKDILIRAGMNDLLAKPIIIEEMSNILQKWLASKKCAPEINSENLQIDDDLLSFMEKGGRIITAAMSIPELDVNAGLSAVAFKEDFYESSLKLLFAKIPKIIIILEKCFEDNNLSEFALHINGLKGSLSAVGAVSLSAIAETLENAGRENDYKLCENMLPEFTDSLRKLEGQLASVFAEQTTAQAVKKAGTRAALDEFLQSLKEAVENYNYELLINSITEMTKLDFGIEINSDTARIKILADNFDYDGITQAINELKYELEKNPELFKTS